MADAAAPPAGDGLAVEENLDLDAPDGKKKGDAVAGNEGDPEKEFPESVAQAPPSVDGPPPSAESSPPVTDDRLFAAQAETDKSGEPPPAGAAPDAGAAAEPKAAPAASGPVMYAPLLKVKDQPFTQKGALLNRVYVARQTDNWKNVSQKLYGTNRAKDLKKWNSGIAARPLRVGDKVYYSSPKDPSDNARMLTFYEEQGMAAQTYAAKDGDNLRKVGQQLLGDKNSWKELWITNRDLASKGALPGGTEIKYWPDTAGGATQQIAGTPPAPPAPVDGIVPPPAGGDMDPTGGAPPSAAPAPPVQAAATPAPPPPVANIEPPPPPPPPPAPPKKPTAQVSVAEPAAADQDMMMWIGAGGILILASVAILVVIKKNRAKRIDLSQTQV